MASRSVPSILAVAVAGIALSGCLDDRRVYDRPDVVVVDRGRYDRYDRRDFRRYDYRDYARAQRVARREEFCRQYPADSDCFGRRR